MLRISKPVKNSSPGLRYITIAVATITVIVAIGFYVLITPAKHQLARPQYSNLKVARAAFTFDSSKAPGWRLGPSNDSSLALFTNNNSCFVSVERRNESVVVDQALQKIQVDLAAGKNISSASSVIPLNLETSSGLKHYDLRQYQVESPTGDAHLYGGQEYGFIPIKSGHLFMQGYCNTLEQLKTTLAAFTAIKYDHTE